MNTQCKQSIKQHDGDEFADIDIDAETYDSYHEMMETGKFLSRNEVLASMNACVLRHTGKALA